MNREDKEKLLLTPEQRNYQIDYIYKYNNLPIETMLDALLESTCKAQLDNVLNQPWLVKPDSTGWWLFECDDEVEYILVSVNLDWRNEMFCHRQHLKSSQYFINMPKGKWQKAIVPVPPVEVTPSV